MLVCPSAAPTLQTSIRLDHHWRKQVKLFHPHPMHVGKEFFMYHLIQSVIVTGTEMWNHFNSSSLLIPLSVFLVANTVFTKSFLIRRELSDKFEMQLDYKIISKNIPYVLQACLKCLNPFCIFFLWFFKGKKHLWSRTFI